MILILGAGEMTQWVKILIALSEVLNLVLSSHIEWLTIFLVQVIRGLVLSSLLHGYPPIFTQATTDA